MNGLYEEVLLAIHGIWNRRWLALAVAWAICIIGWFAVAQIPNSYVSTARVSIELNSLLPDKVGISTADQQKAIERVRQTLTSTTNLATVVRTTDLSSTVANDRDIADRVATLQQSIRIIAQPNDLFEISATASSPKLARQIVQKLIDLFVAENLNGDRTENSETLKFLDTQLAQRQKALQDSEARRADFQNRYLGSLPGTGSLNDRISAARSQLAQVDADMAAVQSGLGAINGQMAGAAATGGNSVGAAGPAQARVAAIQGQLAEARGRGWTESHPDIIALKNQLATAQAAARGEPLSSGPATANPIILSLRSLQADKQAQLAVLAARKSQLLHDLGQLQSKLSSDPGAASEQAQLERDYQVLKDQYDKLLADREDIRLRGQVQSQTNSVKFTLIDPPAAPRQPAAPNRPLILSGILMAGFAAGTGVAFALGQVRVSFSTAAKLQSFTGMTVIGSIGEVMTETQATLRRRNLLLFGGGLGGLGVAYVALLGVEFFQRGLAA